MRQIRLFLAIAIGALLAHGAAPAGATSVQELARLKGHERAVVTGMGIVVGLPGTGDSSKASMVAARPFAKLLTNLGNHVGDVQELAKANAFAIVSVTMQIPPTGGRDGDRFDVSVDKLFNAKSLVGGRLVVSLLRLPGPDAPDNVPLAFAEGPLVGDPTNPASARIVDGGQLIVDVRNEVVQRDGTLNLVLQNEYAGYPVATTIAEAIEDEFGINGVADLATVLDAKNIRIRLPEVDRREPARFIATLMTIPIDPGLLQTPARIVVDRRAGIITVTGDVEIGPVAITHKGMQLSNVAAPAPAAPGRQWVGMDTTDRGRGATRLADLLAALDQLSVATEDQIAIIIQLRKTGALHAELIVE